MTTLELTPTLAKLSHADRLAAAAATTAAARAQVDTHEALAEEVRRLKLAAAAGDLDEIQAADLVAKAERVRIGEITETRRRKALDDALAAEVRVALDVLAELGAQVESLAKEAATAADLLTAALVDPAAAAIRSDTASAYQRDRGRGMVEVFMPGVFPASTLAEKIHSASITTWGRSHIPATAREIVQSFDSDVKAIRSGINGLLAVHKAAAKVFG